MKTVELESLRLLLVKTVKKLPKTTWRKMFGCDAVFADGTLFGLIWKEGRIGVKLPDEKSFEKLMSVKGSAPWKAGKMVMSKWVLVPESFHKNGKQLCTWLATAHELALANPKTPKKKTLPKK